MFRLVFRLESQGILKESQLGINAVQVPGVKVKRWRGHSLYIESAAGVEREPALWKIGDNADERKAVGSGRNAGEEPEITKTSDRGRGDVGFE